MNKIIILSVLSLIFISCTPGIHRYTYIKENYVEQPHQKEHISNLIINQFQFLNVVGKDDKNIRMSGIYEDMKIANDYKYVVVSLSVSDGFIQIRFVRISEELVHQSQVKFIQEMERLLRSHNIKYTIEESIPWGVNIG